MLRALPRKPALIGPGSLSKPVATTGPLSVSIGANSDIQQVAIFLGPVGEPGSVYVTFTVPQAREFAEHLLASADLAAGAKQKKAH